MKPCLTTLSRHLQAALLGAPCALGDEPRVPVCAEPLGTGEVAEPPVADKPRHQLHHQPWAPGLANPWAHDLGHPQATAIPAQSVDLRLRRVTVGTWAGRTPSSRPRGRQHHERRGCCRAGPGAWFMRAACRRAVRGRREQGRQDRTGRMGAGRGWIWLLPEGVSAAPGDSRSLASHPGKMGVWGAWRSSSPLVPTHLGPGGLCSRWAGRGS